MKVFNEATPQAFRTFVGMAMIKFATGMIGIWGTINLYFFSYLKNHGEDVSSKTNSILMLCVGIPVSLLVLLSTRFSALLGYKTVIKACSIIFAVSPFFLNIALNIYTIGFFFLLLPMACFAISAIPIINCLWSSFPKDLNKVSGFAILFFSLGMITWNIVFFKIVNPENKKAIINEQKQAYFTQEITDNVLTAVNWIFAIAGTFYIAGSFLVNKKEERKTVEELKQEDFVQDSIEIKENQKEKEMNKLVAGLTSQNPPSKGLLQTLKDKKFYLLFVVAYFIPLYLVYLVLFMKIIFMPLVNDDAYLAMCSVILIVAGMLGGPFWGIVADKKGFKKTLLFVCITDLITKIVGLQCSQKWNIIIMYFMIGFNDRGIITIIGPGLIQIFGLEMATELVPYKGFSVILAHLTVPLFQMFLSHFLDYKQILIVFIGFTLIAVYVAYHFNSKIKYTPFSQRQQKELTEVTSQEKVEDETKKSTSQTFDR